MKKSIYLLILLVLTIPAYSQNPHHDDFLGVEFHKERRAELRKLMPDNSVAVLFPNPIRNRANDVDHIYHQDPNFFYHHICSA